MSYRSGDVTVSEPVSYTRMPSPNSTTGPAASSSGASGSSSAGTSSSVSSSLSRSSSSRFTSSSPSHYRTSSIERPYQTTYPILPSRPPRPTVSITDRTSALRFGTSSYSSSSYTPGSLVRRASPSRSSVSSTTSSCGLYSARKLSTDSGVSLGDSRGGSRERSEGRSDTTSSSYSSSYRFRDTSRTRDSPSICSASRSNSLRSSPSSSTTSGVSSRIHSRSYPSSSDLGTSATTSTVGSSTGLNRRNRFGSSSSITSADSKASSPTPSSISSGTEARAIGGSCGVSSRREENNVITASPRLSSKVSLRNNTVENGGLVGLRNLGNTCFMNSVLQCLSNTRPLLEYILGDNYSSDINTTNSSMKGALIKAFSTVIQELWGYPEGSSSLSPAVNTTALKAQLQRFAPRFTGYSQQDAQEFLRYLLEGLHEDVNRVVTKPSSRPILPDVDPSLSDNQKAMEAWKRYLRMDNSKIVDIFVGQLKSTLRCTVCGHCSVTFDPFWDLSLPIPPRTGQVRLQQCFDLFTKEEVLDGEEKPTCSKCQVRRKCTKSFSIQKFPRILVLHLKRFSPMERFRGKLNCNVDFPLSGLDLSAYAASRGQGCVYNAYGVANHSGTTYSGHYTAYCKHPYNGDWHEYNDSRVSTVSPRNVVTSEAYVLFYELVGHSSHL
ncbi:ubiquitin carboxyl-terminal hydrolase 2-like isoform X2 [Hetaerina americana]|uniref:ubiquitin carboxyl-terminal hydrolase 2-like isoform X2 n=1 Tax=Hetaerina americana TaxID=62018 RepID=UPI003A7F38B9